ncbi:cupin domain-containing protein [Xanthomonas campestris]|uniref:(R)-mandelonitrile lyase n=1 Tax=Xanthomonas TaxID=338 RepID=UPI001E5065CF|nr:cupin domain-containing protein [Xanthomonas campestris]MCC5091202.1 cupin domain-containing protein [Xanthomonas campestris]
MKHFNMLLSAVLLSVGSLTAGAAEPAPSTATQQITRVGTQGSKSAPAQYFTGRVRLDMLWPASNGISASGAMVTFEPGARSHWHVHPAGQQLVIESGVGYVQEWGKPMQEVHPGDVVWCPPGVKHWHGAAPGTAMSHLAVSGASEGQNVTWMEPVTDAQYQAR